MPVSKNPKTKPDQVIINITGRNAVEFWTNKFDITTVQLKAAINAVGGAVKNVGDVFEKISLIVTVIQ